MRFCLNSIRKIIIRVTSSKRYQNVRSDQTILGPFANVTLTLCVSWDVGPDLGPNCLKGLSADDNVMLRFNAKLKNIGSTSTCHNL